MMHQHPASPCVARQEWAGPVITRAVAEGDLVGWRDISNLFTLKDIQEHPDEDERRRLLRHCISIDDDLFASLPSLECGVDTNTFGHIPHSCDPSCYIRGSKWEVVALRDLQVGEYVSVNYARQETECSPHHGTPCVCGAESCLG